VSGSNTDFVDPKLGLLIGMNVVNTGRHADNQISIDRDHQMVAGVGEKFLEGARDYWVIEHAVGDPRKQIPVAPAHDCDFDGQDSSFCRIVEKQDKKIFKSPTPVLRYAEEPGRTMKTPGSSAYLRTGVGDQDRGSVPPLA
jgi:hypothetical protein